MKSGNLYKIKLLSIFLIILAMITLASTSAFAQALPRYPDDESPVRLQAKPEPLDTGDILKAIDVIRENYYKTTDETELLNHFKDGIAAYAKSKSQPDPLKDVSITSNRQKMAESFAAAFTKAGISGEQLQSYLHAGIKNMVETTGDRGNRFFTKTEYKKSLSELGFNIGGCGFFVDEEPTREGSFVVVNTIEGSPSDKAGVKPGDLLTAADGKPVKGMNFNNIADLVRGAVGSTVTITVFRPSEKKEKQITITRTWLDPNPNSVKEQILPGDLGIVWFRYLGDRMDYDIEAINTKFKDDGVAKVVWDFRNCVGNMPGGLSLAARYVPKGKIFATRVFKEGQENFKGNGAGYLPIPDAILINKYTSPACMLVALTLAQELESLQIVGMPPQWESDLISPHYLRDGSVITVAYGYYRLPGNKVLMNKAGIEPTVTVSQPPHFYDENKDPQLEKALDLIYRKK